PALLEQSGQLSYALGEAGEVTFPRPYASPPSVEVQLVIVTEVTPRGFKWKQPDLKPDNKRVSLTQWKAKGLPARPSNRGRDSFVPGRLSMFSRPVLAGLILLAASAGSRGAAPPVPSTDSSDPLPPRAVARLGSQRFYHGPGIQCAVLSPDGRRIASAATYP